MLQGPKSHVIHEKQNRLSLLLQGGCGSDAVQVSGHSARHGSRFDFHLAFRHGGKAGYLHGATSDDSVSPGHVLVHEGL